MSVDAVEKTGNGQK